MTVGRKHIDSAPEPAAIVGMACVFPGAPDKETFWRNIVGKVDSVTDAPEDWCADLFLDPESEANDRIYTSRGGFLHDLARFDPLRHGVAPNTVDGGEPDQFLALEQAANALDDAAFDTRPVPGDRVAVILGRGTYINRGFTTVVQHGIMVDRTLAILRQLHPETSDADIAELKAALKASLPPFDADTAPALVPNLVTGRITNRLNFRGTNYIVDAACASSLIAVERGLTDLQAGRCDMAIVGGIHASTPAPIYQIFCQLGALSRAGTIRPFDAEADGTLLAEGVGILCLKRLSDAEAASDRIYALVRGVGVASDGRGLGVLAPNSDGERLALSRAYEIAGIAPERVGLIEAHGTATAAGDATEIKALGEIFGKGSQAGPCRALGSVKSNIGHCLPASGSAGLIKTALALHHRVLPPTLVENPNPNLGLREAGLYLANEAQPWMHGGPEPRCAGVNAFGFGGINAHAILEEYVPSPQPVPNVRRTSEVILLDAPSAEILATRTADIDTRLASVDGGADWAAAAAEITATLGNEVWRAGIVAATPVEAREKLARLRQHISSGRTRLRDRRGLYLASDPLANHGKVAFAFPGEGSQHVGMLRDLMLHFPTMRRWFDLVDGAFADHPRGMRPSQIVNPAGAETDVNAALGQMDIGAEAVFAANQAVAALYDRIGLRADMLVGHSTGEYSAMYLSGITRRDDSERLKFEIRALNDRYERLAQDGLIAPGTLLALASVDGTALEAEIASRDDVFLAMDNCPNQKVVAALTIDAAAWVSKMAGRLGGFADPLTIPRAYHSPAFNAFSQKLEGFFTEIDLNPAETPIYSCLTADLFGDAPEEIARLAAGQWAGRVRFIETIRKMYDDGARVFVECGPRNTLTAFIGDILRGVPHLAVAVDTPARTGLDQFHNFTAQLAVEGVSLDLSALAGPDRRSGPSAPSLRPLKTGIQPMELPPDQARAKHRAEPLHTNHANDPVASAAVSSPAAIPSSTAAARTPTISDTLRVARQEVVPTLESMAPAIDGYFTTMERFAATERDVMMSFLKGRATQPPETPREADRFPFLTNIIRDTNGSRASAHVEFDLKRMPFLADHTLGRHISERDPGLTGLGVVPLTFSLELLAEAAAALCDDLVVVALINVRATRWLDLSRGPLALSVEAERLPGLADRQLGSSVFVRTRLREADTKALRPVLAEAEIELAPLRVSPPTATPFHAGPTAGDPWSKARVYRDVMFHGPTLQAVEGMDICGGDGAEGVLRGLPVNRLLSFDPAPILETDAITLDAVGQLVGVWSAETLPEAFHVFPFRVERIDIFGSALASGETARCRARIALEQSDLMRSDIDVVRSDNTLQCRVTGWWDKRFDLPEPFFRARLTPAQTRMSRLLPAPGGIFVTYLDVLDDALFDGSGGIWAEVLAGLVLARSEREAWDGLRDAAPTRRWDWLRGRVAAKDAVREYLGRDVCPADIPLTHALGEAPEVADWPDAWGPPPVISLSHTEGRAIAAATASTSCQALGIDLVSAEPRDGAFELTAFTETERAVLGALTGKRRDEYIAWFWCGKEATAKAHGAGLAEFTRFVARVRETPDIRIDIEDSTNGQVYALTPITGVSDGESDAQGTGSGPDLVAGLIVRHK